ncbi:MAG: 30S ribosomal protein S9 [Gemmatimonadota bacterium]|nr:30S ribosomal protein S9 [Gemmatimonadota bacterium]MDE2677377.1 30S ribosomal protein S9 [Gemmatimonadota bacterium]MYA12648.1 30S ribosomal protein S9 [Gemmatimonadota bacterium]
MSAQQPTQAVGRRKTSVARVLLRPGAGNWSINGRALDDYFPRPAHRVRIEEPFETAASEGSFDVQVRVRGGGLTGQADAIRLGVARALAVQDDDKRVALRESGMLTRDARKVERKKPGRPKARKRFQFSKR